MVYLAEGLVHGGHAVREGLKVALRCGIVAGCGNTAHHVPPGIACHAGTLVVAPGAFKS